MKLDRTPFIVALERVKPALMSAGSIPSLKHVWLDGEFLYAHNGSAGIRLAYEAELKPCGILGSVLLGLLKSTSAKEIEVTQAKAQIDVKIGRSSSSVPALSIEQNPWPYTTKDKTAIATITLTDELLAGLKQVRIIKPPKTPNNPGHYGAVIFPEIGKVGGKARYALYTTDSKVIAEVFIKGVLPKELQRVVLTHEFIAQLLIFKAGAKVTFYTDSMLVEADGVQVWSNLLDTTDVWDIPELVDKTVTGDEKRFALPKDFGEALDRAEVLAGSDPDKNFVTLTTSKKELTLTGKLESGQLLEKFALATVAPESKMTIGLEHLKTLCKEAEEFAIAKKALLLFGKNDVLFLITQHG